MLPPVDQHVRMALPHRAAVNARYTQLFEKPTLPGQRRVLWDQLIRVPLQNSWPGGFSTSFYTAGTDAAHASVAPGTVTSEAGVELQVDLFDLRGLEHVATLDCNGAPWSRAHSLQPLAAECRRRSSSMHPADGFGGPSSRTMARTSIDSRLCAWSASEARPAIRLRIFSGIRLGLCFWARPVTPSRAAEIG